MHSKFLPGWGYFSYLELCMVAKLTRKILFSCLVSLDSGYILVLVHNLLPLRSSKATAWEGISACTQPHPLIWIKITFPKMTVFTMDHFTESGSKVMGTEAPCIS